MNIIKNFFSIGLFLGCLSLMAIREKTVSITLLEDRVGDVRFTQRRDVIDGKIYQEWLIDGKKVDFETFEETYLNQEKELLRAKRVQEREQRERQSMFHAMVQQEIITKLVSVLLDDLERAITILSNDLLKDYVQYTEKFPSWDAIIELQEQCANLKTRIKASDVGMQELKNFLCIYEPYLVLLTDMYQTTVTYAIKHCDDTKILKELLILSS